MNLILLFPDEINDNGLVEIDDHRADHIVSVLGSKAGDQVRVGVVNGQVGTGLIQEIRAGKPSRVVLKFTPQDVKPERPPVDLILAMPRPIMLKRIISQATAMGVGKLFLINAARVEKSFFHAGLLQEDKMLPHILHGLEQARDTLIPEVEVNKRFKVFVEDRIPELSDHYSLKLAAHPEAEPLTSQINLPVAGRVLLAIGPEGGWTEYEMGKFEEQEFTAFSFGKRILKVDTAVVALLAQIYALRTVM